MQVLWELMTWQLPWDEFGPFQVGKAQHTLSSTLPSYVLYVCIHQACAP